MGWIQDATGSYTGGLLALAAVAVMAMFIVLVLGHDRSLDQSPDAVDPVR